jgi:hypothetical protein
MESSVERDVDIGNAKLSLKQAMSLLVLQSTHIAADLEASKPAHDIEAAYGSGGVFRRIVCSIAHDKTLDEEERYRRLKESVDYGLIECLASVELVRLIPSIVVVIVSSTTIDAPT